MNCAEHPFNMGMFYNSRCHSKWVCFQIPNTHIRAFLYWSRPPGLATYRCLSPTPHNFFKLVAVGLHYFYLAAYHCFSLLSYRTCVSWWPHLLVYIASNWPPIIVSLLPLIMSLSWWLSGYITSTWPPIIVSLSHHSESM